MLFFQYAPDNEEQRFAFSDNYHFTDAYQNLMTDVLEKKEESHF